MPLIKVKLIEKAFTPTEKKELVTKITDAMVSIKQPNRPAVAWADIEDVLSDQWEIGAPAMTTDAIRDLVAGE
jgi:4-oxalocrotonate tautomerase